MNRIGNQRLWAEKVDGVWYDEQGIALPSTPDGLHLQQVLDALQGAWTYPGARRWLQEALMREIEK